MTDGKDAWEHYEDRFHPDTTTILCAYTQFIKTKLQNNEDLKHKNNILDIEASVAFNGINNIMKTRGEKYISLYLDQIEHLSIEEQQRINTLLFYR